MNSREKENERDFVTRQYASLVAGGMSTESARAKLGEVLGKPALRFLEAESESEVGGGRDTGARLAQAAEELGGNAADTRAAFTRSIGEARLLALDWWRPIRTFLLYILFLLALALAIAAYFMASVLPAFAALDQHMHTHGQGTAAWIMSDGAMRLFGPLIVIAILLVALAAAWFWTRVRISRLQPLTGMVRLPWLYGRGGSSYRTLVFLEYASVLHAGDAKESAITDAAKQLIHWPAGRQFGSREVPIGEQLAQASQLGTFAQELDWQRRLCWSVAQSRLEMSRDRLILFSRVIFYLLIGYMVTVLYLPIFTLGNILGPVFFK